MDRSDAVAELAPLLEGRASFYRVLYKWYFCPMTQDDVDALDADSLKTLAESASSELEAEGYNDMYRFLRRKNTGTAQELRMDFTRGFLGTATYQGLSAQPYASLYLSPANELMGAACRAVHEVYKRNRVKLAEGVDLPDDHLAFMFEFLAVLNDRALEALQTGDCAQAAGLLREQRAFLDEHVLTWFGRFFNLAMKIMQTRFYHGVLKVTRAFLTEEPDRIADIAAALTV